MRVLHLLDHSIPLHSGYTFRTLAILREQRSLGWETLQLTTPKQGAGIALEETVDGLKLHRTPSRAGAGLAAQMRLTAACLAQVVRVEKRHLVHAHSLLLNALPALWVQMFTLMEASRRYIESHLPHIGQPLQVDTEQVIAQSEVQMAGLTGSDLAWALARCWRADSAALDLANLGHRNGIKARAGGLCW